MKQIASGAWQARVPRMKGSTDRVSEYFDSRTAAEVWIADAYAALDNGLEVPAAPGRTEGGRIGRVRGHSFKNVALRWHQEKYVEDRWAGAGRSEDVLRHIDRIQHYYASKKRTFESFTRDDERAMYRWFLAGQDRVPVQVPAHSDRDALLTLDEVLALPGICSRATFKRRERLKQIVAVERSPKRWRVGDVYAPEAELFDRARKVDKRRFEPLAYSTASDVAGIFKEVVTFGRVMLQLPVGDNVGTARVPRAPEAVRKTQGRSPQAVSLAQTVSVAGRLHAVHQTALWMMRVLGLRIGEAYGVLVEDVTDLGVGMPGLIFIHRQGGRVYEIESESGLRVRSAFQDWLKNTSSVRTLVVPAPLMDLLRTVIDVFHTFDAAIDPSRRLIPGLRRDNESGAGTFRAALALAAKAAGCALGAGESSLDEYFAVVPRDLRKAMNTELHAQGLSSEVRTAVLGHRAGPALAQTVYLLEHPDLGHQRKAAEAMTKVIESEIGTLFTPTTVRCTTGVQKSLADRADEIDGRLQELGWLVLPSVGGRDLIPVGEAAAIFGRAEDTVRAWISAGLLPSLDVARKTHVFIDDVDAVLERQLGLVTFDDLAHETGWSYDQVRQFVNRNGLDVEVYDGRTSSVPATTATRVREYVAEQKRLRSECIPLKDLAKELGVSVALLDVRIKRGELRESPTRLHGGVRAVTNVSANDFREKFRGSRRRSRRAGR